MTLPPSSVDLIEQIDENQSVPTNESTNMLELDQWDAVCRVSPARSIAVPSASLPMPCSTCWRLDLIQSSGRRWQNEIHEAGRRPHVFLELLAPAQASDAAVARINPPDSAGAVACPALGRLQSRRPRIPVPCPDYSAGHGHRKASCHRKQPAGGPRMPWRDDAPCQAASPIRRGPSDQTPSKPGRSGIAPMLRLLLPPAPPRSPPPVFRA